METMIHVYGIDLYTLDESGVYDLKSKLMGRKLSNAYINKVLLTAQHWLQMHGVEVKFKRLPEPAGVVEFLDKHQVREIYDDFSTDVN